MHTALIGRLLTPVVRGGIMLTAAGASVNAVRAQDAPESVFETQSSLTEMRADIERLRRNDQGLGKRRQGAPDDPFVLEVPDRFQPLGIRAGDFLLHPAVEIGAVNNNNVRIFEDSADAAVTGVARVEAASQNPAYLLGGFVQAAGTRYFSKTRENTAQLSAGANFRRPFGSDLAVEINVTGGQFTEDRATAFAPVSSLKPVRYDRVSGRAALRVTPGRLALEPWVKVDRFAYHDAQLLSEPTTPLLQRDRSLVRLSTGASLGYAVSGQTLLYVGMEGNRRDYDLRRNPDRDSGGYAVFAGSRIRPSQLTRLDVAVGYTRQNYSGALADPAALYLRASLDWSPLRETLVHLRAVRDISESGALNLGGVVRTIASAGIEEELRRNLRIEGSIEWQNYNIRTIDADDNRYRATGGLRYLASRNLELFARGEWLISRPSNVVVTPQFDRTLLAIGARAKL